MHLTEYLDTESLVHHKKHRLSCEGRHSSLQQPIYHQMTVEVVKVDPPSMEAICERQYAADKELCYETIMKQGGKRGSKRTSPKTECFPSRESQFSDKVMRNYREKSRIKRSKGIYAQTTHQHPIINRFSQTKQSLITCS